MDDTVNVIVIQLPSEEAAFLTTALTKTGLQVIQTPSEDDNSVTFLQVADEITSGTEPDNGIVSNGKDIQQLYDRIYDMRVEDSPRFKPERSLITQLRKKKIIIEMFPLHNRTDKHYLTRKWVYNVFGKQPIFAINDYLGSDVATYFSWMGFYTTSLLFPCLAGLFQKAYQYHNTPDSLITWISLMGVLANFIWAAFFLLGWGSINDNILTWTSTQPRDVRRSEYVSRPWIPQTIKQTVSVTVTVTLLLGIIGTTYGLLKFDYYINKEWLVTEYSGLPEALKTVISFIPEIFLSLSIILFDIFYTTIAEKLTHWENYQYITSYETALMSKLIVFRLFNCFYSLLYVGFILQDLELLEVRLMNLLIVQQIKSNVGEVLGGDVRVKVLQVLVSLIVCSFLSEGFYVSVEKLVSAVCIVVVLYICKKLFLGKLKYPKFLKSIVFQREKKRKGVCGIQKEAGLRAYESTYLDYLEMLIQYGYVLLFSPVYPLAATYALVNNIIEVHTDAFRLVKLSKRPFPTYSAPSKFWRHGFAVMTLCGVITNSLIVKNSKVFGDIPLKRGIFVFLCVFVACYFGVRKFVKGIEKNIKTEKVE